MAKNGYIFLMKLIRLKNILEGIGKTLEDFSAVKELILRK